MLREIFQFFNVEFAASINISPLSDAGTIFGQKEGGSRKFKSAATKNVQWE